MSSRQVPHLENGIIVSEFVLQHMLDNSEFFSSDRRGTPDGGQGWPLVAEEGWTNTQRARRHLEKSVPQKPCLGSRPREVRREPGLGLGWFRGQLS